MRGPGLPFVLRSAGGRPRLTLTREGGEEVTLLEGENRPTYELVGAAYVHGIMDGEGMVGSGVRRSFLLK